MITFDATIEEIGTTAIARLPDEASKQLPSRGQVAVAGTLNGKDIQMIVEPDGRGGHWIKLTKAMIDTCGDSSIIHVEVEPAKAWPEPKLPKDFSVAIDAAPDSVQQLWQTITPMARWEWVRWINETRNTDTRTRRIEVSISKLSSGKRRPCCFNLSACTDPDVAKSGQLISTSI